VLATAIEEVVARIAPTGGWLTLSAESAGGNVVRGAWLAEALATDNGALRGSGVRLRGACVSGPLDLANVALDAPLIFDDCEFDGPVHLDGTRCRAVAMTTCELNDLSALGLATTGGVDISRSRVASGGTIDFTDATIGASLRMAQMSLSRRGFPAVVADNAVIKQDVDLSGTRAIGQVSIRKALIEGSFLAVDASTYNLFDDALSLSGASITHDVHLDGFNAGGTVRITGAKVGGDLSLVGAQLRGAGPDGAFNGDRLVLGGRLLFSEPPTATPSTQRSREAFAAAGTISLVGAHIGGNLVAERIRIDAFGDGLRAPRIDVAGDLSVRGSEIVARSVGQPYPAALKLSDAALSSLVCVGTRLACERGFALIAERLVARGTVFLTSASTTPTPGEPTLHATGTVRLLGAKVDGEVTLEGAILEDEEPGGCAFDGRFMTVRRALVLSPQRLSGSCDLASAKVERLVDAGDWCRSGYVTMLLDGFVYASLSAVGAVAVDERLRRLRLQPTSPPQPYTQLMEAYRRAGEDRAARKVAIAREADRVASPRTPQQAVAWVWTWLLRLVVGNGYAPARAIWALLLLISLGSLVFWKADSANLVVPTKSVAGTAMATSTACGRDYPCFQPIAFAVDVIVPVISLQQKDNWRADPSRGWGADARIAQWILTALGWLITSAFVAAVAGIVKRD